MGLFFLFVDAHGLSCECGGGFLAKLISSCVEVPLL